MIAVVLTLMQTVVLSEIVLPPQYTYGFYKWSGWDPEHKPLGRCEGDCDNDDDCGEGLYCFHDVDPNNCYYDAKLQRCLAMPGCDGTPYTGWFSNADYCFYVPRSTGNLQFFSWHQTGGMHACQGDCDEDNQCVGSLRCYRHYSPPLPPPDHAPPGCSGIPEIKVTDKGQTVVDYCFDPAKLTGVVAGVGVNVAASDGFASGDSDDEPIEDMEPDQVATNEETASFNDFIPTALGAAAGAAVIVMIVAVVVAMRKKDAAKENVSSSKDVVHVPDESVVTDTAKERETEIEMEVAAE